MRLKNLNRTWKRTLMLYFNTSQLHQSRKWYFFQKNRWFAGSLKMCWNIESKSVCWVTGIAAQRSGGCSKIPAFVPQLSTRYYCFSLHCASIVLLLCVRFCAHIPAAAQRAGPSRCPTPVLAIANALLTIYTLHIFLLQPLSWNFYEKEKSEVSQENLS